MKVFSRTLYVLLATVVAVVFMGCRSTSVSLPRASNSEINKYEAAGEKVFKEVASEGTNRLHSLMVVKDDEVVYEKWAVGYEPEQLHVLWSASKTFTALAVGFAEQEGLLSVEDKVVDFLEPHQLPLYEQKWLEDITIHHLLTMSSGLGDDHSLRQIRNGMQKFYISFG